MYLSNVEVINGPKNEMLDLSKILNFSERNFFSWKPNHVEKVHFCSLFNTAAPRSPPIMVTDDNAQHHIFNADTVSTATFGAASANAVPLYTEMEALHLLSLIHI